MLLLLTNLGDLAFAAEVRNRARVATSNLPSLGPCVRPSRFTNGLRGFKYAAEEFNKLRISRRNCRLPWAESGREGRRQELRTHWPKTVIIYSTLSQSRRLIILLFTDDFQVLIFTDMFKFNLRKKMINGSWNILTKGQQYYRICKKSLLRVH